MQSVATCSALSAPVTSFAACIESRMCFSGNPTVFACPSLSAGRRQRSRVVVPMAKKEEAPRLYQGYNPKKSVFPAEACDEQGGEACEAEFGEESTRETRLSSKMRRATTWAASFAKQRSKCGKFCQLEYKNAT
ncbi:CCR protein [Klebsormidium nitens]|uniref:CCR protein n=1 Tax=Klebsormidium nitens TaxID=105231 RepID=A0A1Y1IK68_KLENI|nr:CCR protein [Klebsormidium nitens]|eukprot:GAQ89057.1 CCR protein [Klebsormidium nitens]